MSETNDDKSRVGRDDGAEVEDSVVEGGSMEANRVA